MARHQNEFSPSVVRQHDQTRRQERLPPTCVHRAFPGSAACRAYHGRRMGKGSIRRCVTHEVRHVSQIRLEARGGLKPILWRLCEELQDDGLDGAGNPAGQLAWRSRWPGDVAMDPFQLVGCGERKRSRDRLVKGDAAGIEISCANQSTGSCGRSARAPCQRAFPRLLRSIPASGARVGGEMQCRNPSARPPRSRC